MRVGFDRSNGKEFNYLFSTRQIAPQPPMRLKLMQYQAFADALGLAAAPIEFGLVASPAEECACGGDARGRARPLLAVILVRHGRAGSIFPTRSPP